MPVTRRRFLIGAGLSAAAAPFARPLSAVPETAAPGAADLQDWAAVRAQFDLDPGYVHLSTFYIASHPRPVRAAIEESRRALDANPFVTVEHGLFEGDEGDRRHARVRRPIAEYLGTRPEQIALTGSTTMGLSLVYGGLRLGRGHEILTTTHDHYCHHEAIRLAAEKSGAAWRKVPLHDGAAGAAEDEIVARLRGALRRSTRVVGVTWVHSSTGLKLPLRRIAQVVREANKARRAAQSILLVVDGVHGLGAEDETVAEIGCDFFVSGTHKWMFGPRGTGIIWGSPEAWAALRPTIPSFESQELYSAWAQGNAPAGPARASWITPGGFHAFEHQWAVGAAFDFHRAIGRPRVAGRIHALAARCRDGLAGMPRVTLQTPRSENLAAGIVCFSVEGMTPPQVVQRLLDRKIVASSSPYAVSYVRVAPGIMNTPEEIETMLREVNALARA